MNLFALTNVAGTRIVRFPLTADLQSEVENVFADQLSAFEDGIVETVPFDGRYPTLTHGGLSLLEVLSPFVELGK